MFIQIFSPPISGFGSIGKVTMKVVPLPLAVLTVIVPPCASMIRLHIAKPKPMPCAFVVNKRGEKFWHNFVTNACASVCERDFQAHHLLVYYQLLICLRLALHQWRF